MLCGPRHVYRRWQWGDTKQHKATMLEANA
jgi:hypothetical protein